MTKTENTEATCYFCQGPATNIKNETNYVETEQADGTVKGHFEIDPTPICLGCNEENYDGTETYPELLPL